LFDHVIANEFEWNDSEITGMKENVVPHKLGFNEHLEELGLDPSETAYIEDHDVNPFLYAGVSILSPTVDPGLKDSFNEYALYVHAPDSWKDIEKIVGL
jgi:hypothetical protein